MIRFAQRYTAVILAYFCVAVALYYLCFGSLANVSVGFLQTAAALFNIRAIAALSCFVILVFLTDRKRFETGGLLAIVLIALAQVPFFSAFHMIKLCIPQIVGFWADPTFAGIDRSLHGGTDAFVLYQSVLGNVVPERLIVNLYFPVWVAIAYIYPAVIAAIDPDETRAMRHIWLHLIVWILLGNVLAIVFSSAGPIYFTQVTGAADFGYIQDFLRASPETFAWMQHLQDSLWAEHQQGALGTGVSAFPSLHVAAATLVAVWLVDRYGPGGLWGALFPALIQYGSVITGFHYAVDGYASILVVLFCHAILRNRGNGLSVAG